VTEAERTRLEAPVVAAILVLRAAFVVTFGALALLAGGGALALAVALALANLAAALPGLVRLAPYVTARVDRAVVTRFLAYGLPLVVAFGVTALGQNVDRLLLAHVVGTAELGSYGATSDFLKQSFGVIGEAITLAVVSIAKNAAIRGDDAAARRTLEDAFRALAMTTLFGAAFMVTFSGELVQVVFGPEFRETARVLVPSLIVANGVLIFRAFYFGQAIYFGQSSRNEVIASVLMLSVTGALSLALIPRFGIFGAAWAATGGQLAACGVYLLARPRMPLPLASFAGIAAAAAALLAADAILDHVGALGPLSRVSIKLALFAVAGAIVVRQFNILGLRDFAAGLAGRRLLARPIERDDARIADRSWR
jgi:O-antigen/teichoic acid export membrane protein